MARTPRATVPQTSGQGTSRLAYQKVRALTKNANVPQVKGPGMLGGSSSYAKSAGGSPAAPVAPPMNISYGDVTGNDQPDPAVPVGLQGIAGADPKRPPRNPPKGLNLGPTGSGLSGVKGRQFPK